MLISTEPTDFLDRDTRRRIRRKARQLIGMAGFRRADLEDIEQELTIRVWQGLHDFDPEVGCSAAFVTTLLSWAANSLLRLRISRKRGHQLAHRPLAAAWRQPARDTAATNQQAFDLTHDVAVVVAQLPDDLRELAEGLKHESIAAIARRGKMARSTIYLRLAELRRAFAAADLKIFSLASDTSPTFCEIY